MKTTHAIFVVFLHSIGLFFLNIGQAGGSYGMAQRFDWGAAIEVPIFAYHDVITINFTRLLWIRGQNEGLHRQDRYTIDIRTCLRFLKSKQILRDAFNNILISNRF